MRSRVTITALSAALLAAVGAAAGPGCSGEDEPGTDSFLDAYPAAYCDHVYRCCAASERSYGSKEQCRTRVTERLQVLLAFADEASPGARFVSSAAATCLGDLAGTCKVASRAADRCLDEVVVPERSVGQDCLHDVECESYYCVVSGDSGVCVDTSTPGGGCGGDDRGCPEDYFCSRARVCKPLLQAGDSCTGPNECVSGICSPSLKVCGGTTEGVCDGEP